MLIEAMFYSAAYLTPVIPVARRVAFATAKRDTKGTLIYTIPKRVLKVDKNSDYAYVNGHIINIVNDAICENCGGEQAFHVGGNYRSIHNNGTHRYTCLNFEPWGGTTKEWDAQDVHRERALAEYNNGRAIGISLVAWWAVVGFHYGQKAIIKVGLDGDNFAKEFKSNAPVSRDEHKKALDSIKRLEKELSIGKE